MFNFSLDAYDKQNRTVSTTQLMDEGLIARISEGDKNALSELYVQTKTAVYGFALSILRNAPSAEDVMQETYVRVFKSASSYVPQGKPMAWILRIVRNLSLMKLREKSSSEVTLDEVYNPSYESDPSDTLALEAALKILSEEERQIVILHIVSGLKHREIAAILELSLSTVLSKHRRALSKLKNHLKED